MKKSYRIVFASAFAVAVVAVLIILIQNRGDSRNDKPEIVHYPIERSIRYRFTLSNNSNKYIAQPDFFVFAPVKQTATQRVKQLVVSHEYELELDAYGNQLLRLKIGDFAPYEHRQVTVSAIMELASEPNKLSVNDAELAKYLVEQTGIEVRSAALVTQAEQLRVKSDVATASQTLAWVHSHIKYTGFSAHNKGALGAFKSASGDCSEYAYLNAALNRINGLPSRIMAGFVIKQNAFVSAIDYHNWIEVMINGVWHSGDPQNNLFQEQYATFIAFKILAEDAVGAKESFDGLAFSSVEELAIEME